MLAIGSAPPRMVAEVAFEEAELLGLRIPSAANTLFAAAARYYREVDDPLGELLALLAATGDGRPDRAAIDAALDRVGSRYPDVADRLTAHTDPGPWTFWSSRLRDIPAEPVDQPPQSIGRPPGAALPPSEPIGAAPTDDQGRPCDRHGGWSTRGWPR